jgi:hypothetical protein
MGFHFIPVDIKKPHEPTHAGSSYSAKYLGFDLKMKILSDPIFTLKNPQKESATISS